MGRQTSVKFVEILSDENKGPMTPSSSFIDRMEKKYNITYQWKFNKYGDITFDGKNLYGEPEDNIKALLETTRHNKTTINGKIVIHDDLTAGSYLYVIYIQESVAIVYEFDFEFDFSNSLGKPLKKSTITLDKRK